MHWSILAAFPTAVVVTMAAGSPTRNSRIRIFLSNRVGYTIWIAPHTKTGTCAKSLTVYGQWPFEGIALSITRPEKKVQE